MPAHLGAEQGGGVAHAGANESVAASLDQRLGAELSGGFGDSVGQLHVVDEPLPLQFFAEALQQRPSAFFRPQRDALVIDQGNAVAVTVEGHAQMCPLAINRLAQFIQCFLPRTVGDSAVEAVIDHVVNGREEALRKNGVQVATCPCRPAAKHGIQHHMPLGRQRFDEGFLQASNVVEGDVESAGFGRRAVIAVALPLPCPASAARSKPATSSGVVASPSIHFNPLTVAGLCEAVTIAQPLACSRRFA